MYYNHERYPDPTAGKAIKQADQWWRWKRELKGMTRKEFYKSRAWRRARDAYIATRKAMDGGLCEVCGRQLGKVVHHIKWLTDQNVTDPDVALNFRNFRYECQDCHNKEKDPDAKRGPRGQTRYEYGPNGEIISKENSPHSQNG